MPPWALLAPRPDPRAFSASSSTRRSTSRHHSPPRQRSSSRHKSPFRPRSSSRPPFGTSEPFRSPSSPYLTSFPAQPAHAGPGPGASRSTPHLSLSPYAPYLSTPPPLPQTRLSFSPSSRPAPLPASRYAGLPDSHSYSYHDRPSSPHMQTEPAKSSTANGKAKSSIASRWRSKSRGGGKGERGRDTAPRLAPLVFAPVDLSGVVLAAYVSDADADGGQPDPGLRPRPRLEDGRDERGLGRGRIETRTRTLRGGEGEIASCGRGRGRGSGVRALGGDGDVDGFECYETGDSAEGGGREKGEVQKREGLGRAHHCPPPPPPLMSRRTDARSSVSSVVPNAHIHAHAHAKSQNEEYAPPPPPPLLASPRALPPPPRSAASTSRIEAASTAFPAANAPPRTPTFPPSLPSASSTSHSCTRVGASQAVDSGAPPRPSCDVAAIGGGAGEGSSRALHDARLESTTPLSTQPPIAIAIAMMGPTAPDRQGQAGPLRVSGAPSPLRSRSREAALVVHSLPLSLPIVGSSSSSSLLAASSSLPPSRSTPEVSPSSSTLRASSPFELPASSDNQFQQAQARIRARPIINSSPSGVAASTSTSRVSESNTRGLLASYSSPPRHAASSPPGSAKANPRCIGASAVPGPSGAPLASSSPSSSPLSATADPSDAGRLQPRLPRSGAHSSSREHLQEDNSAPVFSPVPVSVVGHTATAGYISPPAPIPLIVVSRPSSPDVAHAQNHAQEEGMALDMLRRASLRVRGKACEVDGGAVASGSGATASGSGSSSLLRRITMGARGMTRTGTRAGEGGGTEESKRGSRASRRPRTAPELGVDEWGLGPDRRVVETGGEERRGHEEGEQEAWEVVDAHDADGWAAPDVQVGRGTRRRFTRRFGRARRAERGREADEADRTHEDISNADKEKDEDADRLMASSSAMPGRGAARDGEADDARMTSVCVDDGVTHCAVPDALPASARGRRREPRRAPGRGTRLDMDHDDSLRDPHIPCDFPHDSRLRASNFSTSDYSRKYEQGHGSQAEDDEPKSKSASNGQTESEWGRCERAGNAAENENSIAGACQHSGCQHCSLLPPNTSHDGVAADTMTALLAARVSPTLTITPGPSFSSTTATLSSTSWSPSSNQHQAHSHPQSYLQLKQPYRRPDSPPHNGRRSNERSRSPKPLLAGPSRLNATSTSTSTTTSPSTSASTSHPYSHSHSSDTHPDTLKNAKHRSPSRSHSRSHSHPSNTAHISTSNSSTSNSRPSNTPDGSPSTNSPTQTRPRSRSHTRSRSRSRSGSPRPRPLVLNDIVPPVPPLPPLSSSVPPLPPPPDSLHSSTAWPRGKSVASAPLPYVQSDLGHGGAYTLSEVGHAYTASDAGHGAYTSSDGGHGHAYAMSDVGHGTMSDIGHLPASGSGRRQPPPSAFNLRAFGMTPIKAGKDKSQGDKEKEKGGSFVRRASMKRVRAMLRRLSGSGGPRDEEDESPPATSAQTQAQVLPLASYTSSPGSYTSPVAPYLYARTASRHEAHSQGNDIQATHSQGKGKLVKPRRALTADTPRLSMSSSVFMSEPARTFSEVEPLRPSSDLSRNIAEQRALVRVSLAMQDAEVHDAISNANSTQASQSTVHSAPVRKRTASHGKLTKPRPASAKVDIPISFTEKKMETTPVSPRRAKFTLGAPADESDVERSAPTIEHASPPAPPAPPQATPRPPLHRSTAHLDPSAPDAPGRRRWTLAAAMADEGVSDAGLVRELERMREIGVWARERARARAAAGSGEDIENGRAETHLYGYDEDAEMGLGVWLDREGMMERERERERGMCDSPAPGPSPAAVEEREEVDRRASAPPAVPTHGNGQSQATTTAPGRASAPPPTPVDPQAEWHTAQRALLICRELLLTEKRYQRLLSALHAGHTAPPPPALMRALAGELSSTSARVLAGMTAAPGAAGVARALLDNAEEVESVYVRWCGAVGAWFGSTQQDGAEEGVVKKKRSKGAGGLFAGSGSGAGGGEPEGSWMEGREKESPLKRASAGWRRSMTSVPSLVRDASGVSLVYAGSSAVSTGHADETSSGEQGAPMPKAERLPLVRDLAILPTQRVMRYVLLYRDLLAHTPPTSPARPIVERACAAATRIAARCDRAQDHAAFVSSSSASSSSSQHHHHHHHPNSTSYSHSASTNHSHSQSHRGGAQGATRAGSGASTSSRGSAITRAASPTATTNSSASHSTAPTSVALSRVGSGGPREGMSAHGTASAYAYTSGSSSGCGSRSPSSTPATTPGSGPYSEDGSGSYPAHGSVSHPPLPPLPPVPPPKPVLQGKPVLQTKRSGLGNGVRRLSMSSVSLSLMSSMGMRSRSAAALPAGPPVE